MSALSCHQLSVDAALANTYLDALETGLVPLIRSLKDSTKARLNDRARSHKPVRPCNHSLLNLTGDAEGIVQREPSDTPSGEQEALGKAGESYDRHGVGQGGEGHEGGIPCLR